MVQLRILAFLDVTLEDERDVVLSNIRIHLHSNRELHLKTRTLHMQLLITSWQTKLHLLAYNYLSVILYNLKVNCGYGIFNLHNYKIWYDNSQHR